MEKAKAIKRVFLAACLMLAVLMAPNVKAEASSAGVTPLDNGKVYKAYDLDGDKKRDRIQLRMTESKYGGIIASLYVNGKRAYKLPGAYSNGSSLAAGYEMITLGNGRNFIYAWTEGSSQGISNHMILRYKGNKIYKVADFTNALKNYQGISCIDNYPISGITVSGNTVKVCFTSMNWTLGMKQFVFRYTYKNETLVRTSYAGKIMQENYTYTVAKSLRVYKKVGSTAVAFTVPPNEKICVPRYYLKNGSMWLKVINSEGKAGWIKAVTGSSVRGLNKSPLFANTYYVG